MAEITGLNRELISGFEPQRPDDGHKNTFGTALICAGSEFMTGAAVLACGAALRSGAGLVRVFSEERTLNAVSINEPCTILEERPSSTAELLRKAGTLCKRADSVLIGSGIPEEYRDLEALTELFLQQAANVVLDAGALSGRPDVMQRIRGYLKARQIPAVITPHIGEFARMLKLTNSEVSENAEKLASDFARGNNCVTVLKSYKTLIAAPDGSMYINDCANSGLAKGGSGDVLAGLLTGFLAQGMAPEKAACAAVYIHSMAGKAASEELGARAVLPEDLPAYLPEAYTEAGWGKEND